MQFYLPIDLVSVVHLRLGERKRRSTSGYLYFAEARQTTGVVAAQTAGWCGAGGGRELRPDLIRCSMVLKGKEAEMKVRPTSARGRRRCSAGVERGHEWLFVSTKMKGLPLAAEHPQSQHFPGLLPKSLSGGRGTNEAALATAWRLHRAPE